MKIKLLRMWNGHPAGRELTVNAGPAAELIRRGIAEEVDESAATGGGSKTASKNVPTPGKSGKPKLLANVT